VDGFQEDPKQAAGVFEELDQKRDRRQIC